jgi:hypothetical protein
MSETKGVVIDRAAAVRIATTLGWMPPEELEQLKNENEYLHDALARLWYDYRSIERAFKQITGATWERKADHPKLEWIGLTAEEIDQGLLRSDYAMQNTHAWRSGVVFAMTQLKEKNT